MLLNNLEEFYRKFVAGRYNWGPDPWNNSAQRDERAIRLLIDANANICISNRINKTPLDLAENDLNIKNLLTEQKKVIFLYFFNLLIFF